MQLHPSVRPIILFYPLSHQLFLTLMVVSPQLSARLCSWPQLINSWSCLKETLSYCSASPPSSTRRTLAPISPGMKSHALLSRKPISWTCLQITAPGLLRFCVCCRSFRLIFNPIFRQIFRQIFTLTSLSSQPQPKLPPSLLFPPQTAPPVPQTTFPQ